MRKLKYVVAKVRSSVGSTINQPFVFSELINHVDFARMAGFKTEDIVGAGFVFVDREHKFVPHGESVSLKIGTTPEAVDAFESLFNGYGY